MRFQIPVPVVLLTLAFGTGVPLVLGQSEKREGGPQLPKCPVMNDAIDVTVKTLTKAGPVYFCCAGCIGKFEKDPKKYTEEVAAQRAALAKMDRVQVNCPVNGRPVDKKVMTKGGGKAVSFCSKTCMAEFEKSPDKYHAKLEDSYSYQTRCPVSGDKIDPAAYKDLSTGQRVYFCCENCGPRFLKDPAKYTSKLEEQGVNIDLAKLKTGADDSHKDGHDGHDHAGHDHKRP